MSDRTLQRQRLPKSSETSEVWPLNPQPSTLNDPPMPSPFPGMDPFLEDHWGDVHTSLTTYARDQIRTQLPPDLRVRVEEYVGLEIEEEGSDSDDTRQKPDVLISEPWSPAGATTSTAVMEAVSDEPLVVAFPREPDTLRRVLIHDRRGDVLITAIEFLSPGNKYGQARDHFRKKQRDLVAGGVNIVEIDLIRAGGWTVFPAERDVPASHGDMYRIIVVRPSRGWGFECYPAGIRGRLPRIRVPLRSGDRDAILDVQALIDQAWENGGYGDLDYARDPLPGFEDSDRQWIRDRLAQQGIARIL